MFDNNLKPARIVAPGQILKGELDARNITIQKLGQLLSLNDSAVNDIINGEAIISGDLALQLEKILGISADFWLNLEANYRKWIE